MYFFYPNYQVFQPNFMIITPVFVQTENFLNINEMSKKLKPTQNPLQTNTNLNYQQSLLSVKTQQNLSQFTTQFTIKKQTKIGSQLIIQNQENIEKFTPHQEIQVKCQLDQSHKKRPISKLFFGIEWKNQNRNIIPNIMNQMLSYIQKRNKSQSITNKLFQSLPHLQQCTIHKYYCYVKKMKSKMGNYINENQLRILTQIQQPQYLIYSRPEQQFYLKVCRIIVEYFLKNESPLISLTSKRMGQPKRKAHLTAKRALLIRFKQLLLNEN